MLPGPPADLAAWLEQEHEDLSEVSHLLIHWCSERDFPGMREIFAQWVEEFAPAWAWTKHPALSAIVEAASVLKLPQVITILTFLLSDAEADPLTLSIAAQRIRMFELPADVLPTAQDLLMQRARQWLASWTTDSNARSCLYSGCPSLAIAYPRFAVELEGWLVDPGICPYYVGGFLQGISSVSDRLDDVDKERLLGKVHDLVEKGQVKIGRLDIRAACVASYGPFCTQATLPQVAGWLAEEFQKARGLADAAAVFSGKRLLKRFPGARDQLAGAFGSDTAQADRFLSLLDRLDNPLLNRTLPPSSPV